MNSLSKGLRAVAIATTVTLGLAAVGVTTVEAHPRVRVGVWVGGPFWWGPGPYYGYGGYGGYPYVVERPVVVQVPVEPGVVAPSAAQQSNTWYYCRDAQMYYPYVTTCASPWQEVPASPAANSSPEPAAATAPAPVPSSSTRNGTPVPSR